MEKSHWPGLEQPVGAPAINKVPRRMITEAVQEICEKHGYCGGIEVCIRVPEGAQTAQKTFIRDSAYRAVSQSLEPAASWNL